MEVGVLPLWVVLTLECSGSGSAKAVSRLQLLELHPPEIRLLVPLEGDELAITCTITKVHPMLACLRQAFVHDRIPMVYELAHAEQGGSRCRYICPVGTEMIVLASVICAESCPDAVLLLILTVPSDASETDV
eukprot:3906362-Rhodomonas_salina.2